MRRGYAHLFEDEADFRRQLEVLKSTGCAEMLVEREVGEQARNRLDEYIYNMAPGDELAVLRLDVFGRSTGKLVAILDGLIAKEVTLSALEPRPLTFGPASSLPAEALLRALAEHEALQMDRRYRAGSASSRSRARKTLAAPQVEEALRRFRAGESLAAIAADLDVGRAVVDRALSGRRRRGGLGGRSRRTLLNQGSPFAIERPDGAGRPEE